jgi:hypothetical protein
VLRGRAIGLVFFLAACSAGCVLDLDERGKVAISARVPADAERTVAIVRAGSSMAEVELAGRIEVGVPPGAVSIVAESSRAGVVIGRAEAMVDVAAGETEEVMLDLAGGADAGLPDANGTMDGGEGVRSPPIAAQVRARQDGIAGSILSASGTSNSDDFAAWRAGLDQGATISVAEVSLELLLTSQGVAALEELWDGSIVVALEREDHTDFVDIATGDASGMTAIAGADLGAIDLVSGRFNVVIRGATPRTTSDNFDANVRAEVIYLGR